MGVSCHSFGAMQAAAGLPWVDVMLARINPCGVMTDSSPDVYGEGKLVGKRDECMRYAQSCGVLDAMTIGAVNARQVDENLALMVKSPE